jgi:hypothetical protein
LVIQFLLTRSPILNVGSSREKTMQLTRFLLHKLNPRRLGLVHLWRISAVLSDALSWNESRGLFPFDKLTKQYAFADINQAFEDSAAGITLKPIVVF